MLTDSTVGVIVTILVISSLIVAGVLLWRFQNKKSSKRKIDDSGPINLSLQERKEESRVSDVIYNDLQPTLQDTSMTIIEFNRFMSSYKIEYFEEQFKSIPQPQNVSMEVGQSDQNKKKNRYKNICPYDHSRVILKPTADKNEADYINASHIKNSNDEVVFIASQGPTKVTIDDFVRMLWEQNVENVVMLTNLIEEGRAKCEKYWPDSGEAQFGKITIKVMEITTFADYIIRSFKMFQNGKEVIKKFTQFHYTSWPDKGVPVTPWSLIEFSKKVAAHTTKNPVVVHCSAGVGRTGTFIALDNVIRQAQETGRVDFYKTVVNLRKDRVLMIQTAEQYLFLHKSAQAAIVCINNIVTPRNYADIMAKLESKSMTCKTKLEEEFKAVCTVCEGFNNDIRDTLQELDTDGNVYENSVNVNLNIKNRYSSIIPQQRFRPYLSCESKEMAEYINAVFVPGFYKKDRQILTQLPLPTTVVDFWRLVIQYDVSLIVAFEIDTMINDKTFGNYFPVGEDKSLTCPPFEIISSDKKQEPLWEERRLNVQSEKTQISEPNSIAENRPVIHLKCLFTDLSPSNLLSLVTQVRSYNTQSQGRTLYSCRNGAYYSGLICVLSLVLERIENDGYVSVPVVVGEIKSIRPEVIPTEEQYRVIYDVLVRYFETSQKYKNVDTGISNKIAGSSTVNTINCNEFDDINVYANI